MAAVTSWKPHSLARPAKDQLDIPLRRRVLGVFSAPQYVVARRDLPDVPAGTVGRVVLANGFNWLRYRVAFENGVELADLTGEDIEPSGKKARKA
jgi:hypothetical protein